MFFLIALDFITGVWKSKVSKVKVKIWSKRMRWSVVKVFIYVGALFFTACLGAGLYCIDFIINSAKDNQILNYTLFIVKYMTYIISWIETVSIIENGRKINPNSTFLKIIHYLVAIEFIRRIPKLHKVIRETGESENYEQFNKELENENNK